ncbi:MAG: hypothetical protein ACTS6P_01775 [Candidatus Hodgkinia cicadicola]
MLHERPTSALNKLKRPFIFVKCPALQTILTYCGRTLPLKHPFERWIPPLPSQC